MREKEISESIKELRGEAVKLSLLSDEERTNMLLIMAKALKDNKDKIISANNKDLERAKGEGTSESLLHRLELNEKKLSAAIESVLSVASLPSPLGKVKERRLLDEGLILEKVTFPLGVIGMIFEARPDALIQIISLSLKSGNGIVLKGGKEASESNRELFNIISEALNGAPWALLLESHEDVERMLKAEGDIDLLIPRGSNQFVRYVMEHTHIPVMGHADGICSVYIDSKADLDKALFVAVDSKVQYPAACNAAETILVHESIATSFLPRYKALLDKYHCTIYGDAKCRTIIDVPLATEADFHKEFLALKVAIKVVSSLDEAIEHIAQHSSHHTDAIVTEDIKAKERFFSEVDSADVFCNASTRFADGFRFGLGAEVGISTSKLHARGPVGLEGLTTTKWELSGTGNTVAPYVLGERHFIHKELL